MRVRFEVGDTWARLGNKGIVFHIADNQGRHVGKLRIGQAVVEWLPGKTSVNTRRLGLKKFIDEHLNTLPKRRVRR